MGNSLCSTKQRRPLHPDYPNGSPEVSIVLPIRTTWYHRPLSGGNNDVYQTFNEADNRPIVVKKLTLNKMSEKQRQKLQKEVDILATLSHPNIVQFYGSETKKDYIYIYMEYMDGGSLSKILKQSQGGRIQEDLAAGFLAQILQGLVYLHSKGILHRDLKGGNVLYSDGVCKLCDFGSAVHINDLHYSNKGTPGFTAPEVLQQQKYSYPADVWSFGCLAYELVVGRSPFIHPGENEDEARFEADTRVRQFSDTLDFPLALRRSTKSFISKCLQKDPKKRPTVDELLKHPFVIKHVKAWKKTHQVIRPASTPTVSTVQGPIITRKIGSERVTMASPTPTLSPNWDADRSENMKTPTPTRQSVDFFQFGLPKNDFVPPGQKPSPARLPLRSKKTNSVGRTMEDVLSDARSPSTSSKAKQFNFK